MFCDFDTAVIILQGKRNLTDDLWDIPTHKRTIDKENYKEPQRHGLIYTSPKNNSIKQYIRTDKQTHLIHY